MTSLYCHVRPAERAAAEQHVAYQSFYWRLADESNEKYLFDDLRRYSS
jgi:hypothetical protein